MIQSKSSEKLDSSWIIIESCRNPKNRLPSIGRETYNPEKTGLFYYIQDGFTINFCYMTLSEYINSINKRYKTGISREHSYRGDLQNLLEAMLRCRLPQKLGQLKVECSV